MDITNMNPSQLIRVALNDLELCEADTRYRVYMGTWHEPFDRSDMYANRPGCFVCFAGSVMAQSLNTSFRDNCSPEVFSRPISIRLRVLNLLRLGDIEYALSIFSEGDKIYHPDYHFDSPIKDREIAPYTSDSRLFKVDMLRLADDLEDVGY